MPHFKRGGFSVKRGPPHFVGGAPHFAVASPNTEWGAPQTVFDAPQTKWGATQTVFGAPQTKWGAPQMTVASPHFIWGGAFFVENHLFSPKMAVFPGFEPFLALLGGKPGGKRAGGRRQPALASKRAMNDEPSGQARAGVLALPHEIPVWFSPWRRRTGRADFVFGRGRAGGNDEHLV